MVMRGVTSGSAEPETNLGASFPVAEKAFTVNETLMPLYSLYLYSFLTRQNSYREYNRVGLLTGRGTWSIVVPACFPTVSGKYNRSSASNESAA